MPDLNLEAVKARLSAATPGPWIRSGVRRKLGAEDCLAVGPDGALIIFLPVGCTMNEHAEAMADAAFIAHAPTDIADLVAEVERQTEEVRQQKILIGWLADIARKPRVSDEEMALAMKAVELALGEPK